MKRTIFYPNKEFIPMPGSVARDRWDEQERKLIEWNEKQKRDAAFAKLVSESPGCVGDGDNKAYLLEERL